MYNGHQILWMSLNERGIGLSRNTALMRATADIILFLIKISWLFRNVKKK